MLDMTQSALAEKAGVSLPTLRKLEAGDSSRMLVGTVEKVVAALEEAGAVFIPESQGDGEGVRRRKL